MNYSLEIICNLEVRMCFFKMWFVGYNNDDIYEFYIDLEVSDMKPDYPKFTKYPE